jgi:RNA recognition motif-containing protein
MSKSKFKNTKREKNARRQIFLGNISFDASEKEVAEALKSCGVGVFKVAIPTSATGQSKGFGFVDLSHDETRSIAEVIEYINERGIYLNLRRLRAGEVRVRPRKPQGGRGHARSEFTPMRNEFDGDSEYNW